MIRYGRGVAAAAPILLHPSVWRLTPERFVHEYPLDQPAATLWYHDHRMDFTAPQVYRGLAGMFLVRDGVEDALPLASPRLGTTELWTCGSRGIAGGTCCTATTWSTRTWP